MSFARKVKREQIKKYAEKKGIKSKKLFNAMRKKKKGDK